MLSGSFSPGTCTRMRFSPWRWMVGSRVPTSSIRRRTISVVLNRPQGAKGGAAAKAEATAGGGTQGAAKTGLMSQLFGKK